MGTPTNYLGLVKPTFQANPWNVDLNANLDRLSALAAPSNARFVSPAYTPLALGNGSAADRRHFPTIQEAINASNAAGESEYSTIYVWPGDYRERLTLTNSVALVSACPVGHAYAAGSVMIRGDNSANALLTVTPGNGNARRYSFIGLTFENKYDANDAVQHPAYLLATQRQTTFGTFASTIDFTMCPIRAQTWGAHNQWRSVFDVDGFYHLRFMDAPMQAFSYAGGYNDGGCLNIFRLRGINAEAKAATLQVERSRIVNTAATGLGQRRLMDIDDKVTGWMLDGFYNDARSVAYLAGSVGSPSVSGPNSDGQAAINRVTFGQAFVLE